MDVTPLIPHGQQLIQSYSDAGFKISGVMHKGAVLVFPQETQTWEADGFSNLEINDFTPLIQRADDLDVVLLGAGKTAEFFSPDLKNALKNKGLIVEVMDSGAACRTYNVLMAEGRRVVAALLPVY